MFSNPILFCTVSSYISYNTLSDLINLLMICIRFIVNRENYKLHRELALTYWSWLVRLHDITFIIIAAFVFLQCWYYKTLQFTV